MTADQHSCEQIECALSLSLFRLPLVDWLPDETVFSLCSRLHHLSGHHVPANTARVLFGSPRAGTAHDVPSHLNSLVDRMPTLGAAQSVFTKHTLLPFYFPFHEAYRCQSWLEQTLVGNAPNLKANLGLGASRFGAAHPLKACAQCIDEDQRKHDVAYWHLGHQLPGVLVCLTHQTSLQISPFKVTGKDRFGWALPSEVMFNPFIEDFYCSTAACNLAHASLALHSLPIDFCFDADRLASVYQDRTLKLGWNRRDGKTVSRADFVPQLRSCLIESGMSSAWPWLIDGQGVHTMAERLIRIFHGGVSRESHNPLNHLILQQMLFGTWESFMKEYFNEAPLLIDEDETHCGGLAQPNDSADRNPIDERRPVFLERLRQGVSTSCAAKELGIAVGTAMSWASKDGIAPSRRPKLLKDPVLRPLIKALHKGADKQSTANKYGVSVQTITRVLLTEPGLHRRWLDARFQISRMRSRSAWSAIMNAMPQASSVIWRTLEPAAYAWLYRNDRVWLQDSIENRPHVATKAPTRRDWDKRDQSLSLLIENAGFNWVSSHQKGHPTLADLCTQVQPLRPMLSALHKLPLSQLAIQKLCMTRRHGLKSQAQPTLDGIAVSV